MIDSVPAASVAASAAIPCSSIVSPRPNCAIDARVSARSSSTSVPALNTMAPAAAPPVSSSVPAAPSPPTSNWPLPVTAPPITSLPWLPVIVPVLLIAPLIAPKPDRLPATAIAAACRLPPSSVMAPAPPTITEPALAIPPLSSVRFAVPVPPTTSRPPAWRLPPAAIVPLPLPKVTSLVAAAMAPPATLSCPVPATPIAMLVAVNWLAAPSSWMVPLPPGCGPTDTLPVTETEPPLVTCSSPPALLKPIHALPSMASVLPAPSTVITAVPVPPSVSDAGRPLPASPAWTWPPLRMSSVALSSARLRLLRQAAPAPSIVPVLVPPWPLPRMLVSAWMVPPVTARLAAPSDNAAATCSVPTPMPPCSSVRLAVVSRVVALRVPSLMSIAPSAVNAPGGPSPSGPTRAPLPETMIVLPCSAAKPVVPASRPPSTCKVVAGFTSTVSAVIAPVSVRVVGEAGSPRMVT